MHAQGDGGVGDNQKEEEEEHGASYCCDGVLVHYFSAGLPWGAAADDDLMDDGLMLDCTSSHSCVQEKTKQTLHWTTRQEAPAKKGAGCPPPQSTAVDGHRHHHRWATSRAEHCSSASSIFSELGRSAPGECPYSSQRRNSCWTWEASFDHPQ